MYFLGIHHNKKGYSSRTGSYGAKQKKNRDRKYNNWSSRWAAFTGGNQGN